MDGMQMMLRSLGIDPDAMQKQIENVLAGINGMLSGIEKRLADIEAKIDALTEASKNGDTNAN